MEEFKDGTEILEASRGAILLFPVLPLGGATSSTIASSAVKKKIQSRHFLSFYATF